MDLKKKVLWPFLSCWKCWKCFSRRAYLFADLSGIIQKVWKGRISLNSVFQRDIFLSEKTAGKGETQRMIVEASEQLWSLPLAVCSFLKVRDPETHTPSAARWRHEANLIPAYLMFCESTFLTTVVRNGFSFIFPFPYAGGSWPRWPFGGRSKGRGRIAVNPRTYRWSGEGSRWTSHSWNAWHVAGLDLRDRGWLCMRVKVVTCREPKGMCFHGMHEWTGQ